MNPLGDRLGQQSPPYSDLAKGIDEHAFTQEDLEEALSFDDRLRESPQSARRAYDLVMNYVEPTRSSDISARDPPHE